jgi:hypothetical protein
VVPVSLSFGPSVSGNMDLSLNWIGQLLLLSCSPKATRSSSLPACRKRELLLSNPYYRVLSSVNIHKYFKSHPCSYKECTWTSIRFVGTVLKIIFLITMTFLGKDATKEG